MPPLRFFRSQLAQHEAPAVTYYIRGTSTNVNGSETFNIQFIDDGALLPSAQETITCAVDSSGNWEYEYIGKKIYSLYQFAYQNTTIKSCDFSNSDKLKICTNIENAFNLCSALTTLDFSGCTMEEVTNANWAWDNCNALTTFVGGDITFAKLYVAQRLFVAIKITNLDLHSATFGEFSGGGIFSGNTYIQTLNLHNATFAKMTNAQQLFFGMKGLTSLDLSSATFEKVTNGQQMFNQYDNHHLTTISMPEATFNSLTNAYAMFILDGLEELNMPKATFANVTNTTFMLTDLKKLTTFVAANGTIPKSYGFTRSNSGILLTYQSMLNVANWCKDLTGGTAQTVTFNATAWNALTAAEQSNIDTILSGKNWTRAIA